MSSSSTPETTTGNNGGRAETAAAANAGGWRWEVADVVRRYGDEFRARYRPLPEQRRVLWAIENCQTEVLGGHWMHCEGCAREHGAYHSCRNRHCPSCLGSASARWVEAERAQLLAVPYFHVVFTLPHKLNPLLRVNQALLYGLLFQCAAATLQQFAADPDWLGAQLGITAVLHTWGQTMEYHVHLHCVVTGGGLGFDGKRWKLPRKGRRAKGFLFHVKPLAVVFRAKYIEELQRLRQQGTLVHLGQSASLADDASWRKLLDAVRAQNWVVYAKRPFAGPDRVLKYLSRYTHRVAPVSPARAAEGVRAHPALRDCRQPWPQGETRAGPASPRCCHPGRSWKERTVAVGHGHQCGAAREAHGSVVSALRFDAPLHHQGDPPTAAQPIAMSSANATSKIWRATAARTGRLVLTSGNAALRPQSHHRSPTGPDFVPRSLPRNAQTNRPR